MTIIVEGMDNCGKTTLIGQITRRFSEDLRMIKPPGPWPSKQVMMEWLEPSLQTIRDGNLDPDGKIIIYDRYPLISEPIYGMGIRGVSLINNEEVREGFEVLIRAPQPVLIIMCRPPKGYIFDFGERDQMEGVIRQKEHLLDMYDHETFRIKGMIEFYKQESLVSLELLVYDWTFDDSELIMDIIQEHINSVRRCQVISTQGNKLCGVGV